MNVSCGDCGESFFLPGQSSGMIGQGGCENCGGRNLYRMQPTPLHDEMSERNMPLDGKHPDTGGNPLQEGVIGDTDSGWEPFGKRDEYYSKTAEWRPGDAVHVPDPENPKLRVPGTIVQDQGNEILVQLHQGDPNMALEVPYRPFQVLPQGNLGDQVPDTVPLAWSGDPLEHQVAQPSGLQWNDPHNSKTAGNQMPPPGVPSHFFHVNSGMIHFGNSMPLAIFDTHVNGVPTRDSDRFLSETFPRYGGGVNEDVEIGVPHSDYEPGVRQLIENGMNVRGLGNLGQAAPEALALAQRIGGGQVGAPSGVDPSMFKFGGHRIADGGMTFDFSPGPESTHKVIVSNAGTFSAPEPTTHEAIADQNGLHELGFPQGMSLGLVNHDGSTTWLQKASQHQPQQLAQAVQEHMGQQYGHTAPVTVDPQMFERTPDSNDQRWFGEQPGARRELDVLQGPAKRRDYYVPPGTTEGLIRGGKMDTLNTEPYDSFSYEASAPDAEFNAWPTPGPDGRYPYEKTGQWQALLPVAEALGIGGGEAAGAGAAGGAGLAEGGGLGGLPFMGGGGGSPLGMGLPGIMQHALQGGGSNGGGSVPPGAQPQMQQGPSIPPSVEPVTGAVHEADIPGKIDTPSSVPAVDTLDDDPGSPHGGADQHEVNAEDTNKSFYGDGADLGGSQGPPHFDHDDLQQFADLEPSLLKYVNSPESGMNDPVVRAFHEKMESKYPGYLDHGDEGAYQHLMNLAQQPTGVTATTKQADGYPIQPATGQGGFGNLPPQGLGMGMMQQQQPPQQVGQGRCPNCGGTLTADGSCPQCGHKNNPMGMQVPMGGQSVPPMGQPGMATAGVHTADSQGPVTPEQQSMVSQLLLDSGRAHEIPDMLQKPWDYARELAEVQNNPNSPPQPPQDGGQIPSPVPPGAAAPNPSIGPPGGGAPGGAMAPPGIGQQMAAAVARFAADSIAPRCPECNSATTGFMNEDGECRCHSCNHQWKPKNIIVEKQGADEHGRPNTPAAPLGEQHHQRDIEHEQDSSLTWQDDSGQPLQTGQTYEMHSPQYQIPDIVRVEEVKPDSVTITELGEISNTGDDLGYTHEITRHELEMDGLTFSPSDQSEQQQGNDLDVPDSTALRNNVQDLGPANVEQPAPKVQTSSLNAESRVPGCPDCGERQHITSSMSSTTTTMHDCYRCGNVWETRDEDDATTEGLDKRSWLMNGGDSSDDLEWLAPKQDRSGMSRDIRAIAESDPHYMARKELLDQRHEERVAGKKYSPKEQRELIDEDGMARNSDLLDLGGTHYETRDDGVGRGYLVPDEHLILGL